jgi:hypothetical protein
MAPVVSLPPSAARGVKLYPLLFFVAFLLAPLIGHAADKVASAEAAVERFRTACNGEIKKAASAENLKRIQAARESPFLMIARKAHVDIAEFLDPKFAEAIAKHELFGSHTALTQATGDVWVLTYGNMQSLAAYVDAASGAVLCVAFIPEG